jgi:hypothetical protein
MKLIDINQNFINNKLTILGDSLLKKEYKNKWNTNKPTTGYCYIVCEAIFHYVEENDIQIYYINLGKEIGVHWFLKYNNNIIDFTANQFDFPVDYSKGKRIGFFKGKYQTKKGFISERGYQIAKILNLI